MIHCRKPRGLRPNAWALTHLLRSFLRTLAKWRIFKVTVENREVIPAKGRVIIACNHISVSDPIFLWGAVRRNAVALAMAELWRIPGVNILMWALGHIPVKRGNRESGKRAFAAGIRILEHDGILFIYPEGRCSKTGELLAFKQGVADLAFATNAMVIPAGITGSNLVKPLTSRRISRKHRVHLRFGSGIDPRRFTGSGKEEQLLNELRRQIISLTAS